MVEANDSEQFLYFKRTTASKKATSFYFGWRHILFIITAMKFLDNVKLWTYIKSPSWYFCISNLEIQVLNVFLKSALLVFRLIHLWVGVTQIRSYLLNRAGVEFATFLFQYNKEIIILEKMFMCIFQRHTLVSLLYQHYFH